MAPPTKNKNGSKSQDGAEQTALATQGTTAIAEVDDFEDHAGRGFEENSIALQKVPFGNILQASSRLIKTPKNQRPGGAREADMGWFHNTITDEVIPLVAADGGGLEFIPVHFRRCYTLWGKNMGGFKGKFEPEDPRVQHALKSFEFGKWEIDGHDLMETIELYIVYTSPITGNVEACVMNIQSTKISVFKEWNSKVSKFKLKGANGPYTPPLYVNRTMLTTEFDPNGGGDQSFFRIHLHPAVKDQAGVPDFKLSVIRRSDPRFAVAEKFQSDLLEMMVAADYATAESAGSSPAAGAAGERKPDSGF